MEKPKRSDAVQNRERILSVALAELVRAADVPLSAIAKKAGVGQGTFYRHFPTREALVIEVYRHEMLQVTGAAAQLLKTLPPERALREWMNRLAEYAITKAGLAGALREFAHVKERAGNEGYAPVIAAAQMLLDANEAAGTIRPGVTADKFFLATAGIWQIDVTEDWQPRLNWLMDTVMDGLCAGAPARAAANAR
ncbi:TetR/AcrR family transcriptional regulator [Xanthomonas campestris]|uniref:TetR/AcrR family transcriptional regulator n=1 Tax=Xanthomonas campestris TaxID=339 RepID=UPI00096C2CD6|nr:TetR/AcrR family transcriptional regulator [Xanthomonas campestris]MEA9838984.1 TetR/AcrR family transcriptional regulator [Xanthomonas campestris pv. raphani]MEA9876737.1 TetR/AcrR family transcriptional regulator [Xanthomonas campestris pv. raphani]MEA9892533.1 TetR/AcrR family transcriptional regulator [Xanthomonas campestris pv. raphani]MEA9934493.1 TetR/AcrR family transcriptional regulator [Xanthomonas campestris pv. raphani]QLC69890.1 TetR/AcrR family transcriptional regulator [Xanth